MFPLNLNDSEFFYLPAFVIPECVFVCWRKKRSVYTQKLKWETRLCSYSSVWLGVACLYTYTVCVYEHVHTCTHSLVCNEMQCCGNTEQGCSSWSTDWGRATQKKKNETLEGEFCHLKRRQGLRLTYCISVIWLIKAQYISKHQFT